MRAVSAFTGQIGRRAIGRAGGSFGGRGGGKTGKADSGARRYLWLPQQTGEAGEKMEKSKQSKPGYGNMMSGNVFLFYQPVAISAQPAKTDPPLLPRWAGKAGSRPLKIRDLRRAWIAT